MGEENVRAYKALQVPFIVHEIDPASRLFMLMAYRHAKTTRIGVCARAEAAQTVIRRSSLEAVRVIVRPTSLRRELSVLRTSVHQESRASNASDPDVLPLRTTVPF